MRAATHVEASSFTAMKSIAARYLVLFSSIRSVSSQALYQGNAAR